jgi:hypothetical protein
VVERDLAAVVERARVTVKVVTVVATAEGVKEGVEEEAVRAAARAVAAKVEARVVARAAPAAWKAKAESADEMAAPEPVPTGATKGKAPEAPKLVLAVEEGFELQNTPIVSSFLGMWERQPAQRG